MVNETKQVISSKYQQVSHILFERIRRQEFRNGQMIPSESNLMKEYGVSRVTIRRALGQLVKDGLIRSEQGSGYVVRGQTVRQTVGLLYGEKMYDPDENPCYRLIIQSLQRTLPDLNLQMQLYNIRPHGSELLSDREQLIHHLRKGMLKGLLSLGWPCPESENAEFARTDRELQAIIQELTVPYTGFGDNLPNTVTVDYTAMSYLGTKHFLDQGLSRVALITYSLEPSLNDCALRGYHQALSERGLPVLPQYVKLLPQITKPNGYLALRELWSQEDRPQAVVITDDLIAEGAMSAILELGLDVPGSLQVATLHHRGSGLFFPKPFVRLEIDLEAMAGHMVEQLRKVMQNPSLVLEPAMYPPKVVVDAGTQWSNQRMAKEPGSSSGPKRRTPVLR